MTTASSDTAQSPALALITGASGQDGNYLTKWCRAQGVKVIGASRRGPDVVIDVGEFVAVEALIKEARPAYVFHLAAESTLAHDALLANRAAIGAGAANVLEACWRHCRGARVFVAGSALQFFNNGTPIGEDTPFEAKSPYAAERIYATYLARYFRGRGLRCFIGYLFHHDSPLRSELHLSKKISQAAMRIAAGSREELVIGNLSVEKEWNFAGDVVEAMWTLIRQDEVPEAVIGCGKAYPIRDWVEACFQIAGLDWKSRVREDRSYRPDFTRLVSNPERMRRLGWVPRTSMRGLASMMMNSRDTPNP